MYKRCRKCSVIQALKLAIAPSLNYIYLFDSIGTTSVATAGRRHHPNLEYVVALFGLWWVHVDEARVCLPIATQATNFPEILGNKRSSTMSIVSCQ
jgi:hypothetical protein